MEKVDRKCYSICQQLQKWDDKTDAEAHLKTLEAAMHEGNFEEADWLPTLRKYLTGRSLAIYNVITPYCDISYAQLKADILERLGLTPQQARRTIWLSKPSWKRDQEAFFNPLFKLWPRLRQNIITPHDAAEELFQGVLPVPIPQMLSFTSDSAT